MVEVAPPKRKKGRPPKNRELISSTEENGATPKSADGRARKITKKKQHEVINVLPPLDGAFVGQQVHGVLDGSFDAGYLLTVRVGNSQTVLRGAVFEPTLSAPICKANDIAPNSKFIEREENVAALQNPIEKCNARESQPCLSNGLDTCASPMPLEEVRRPVSGGLIKEMESNVSSVEASRDAVMAL